MAARSPFTVAELKAFNQTYDASLQELALNSRGAFIKAFPIKSLPNLTIDTYVIGLQAPTFCDYVEAKTRHWAAIQGATAFKFGVYFGRTKTDPERKYRYTRKFGNSPQSAFAAVKTALLELVQEGAKTRPDFSAIDHNLLSPMFKAKILSLYFPNRFLAVCSKEPLEILADKTGLDDSLHWSEIQNQLLEVKDRNATTRAWSNPKFMRFLYDTYVRQLPMAGVRTQKLRPKMHRKVNFEDIQAQRGAKGKKAERFALQWEKDRLIGAELSELIEAIDDRTEYPTYGYDFLSHTAPRKPRFIEVKSVSKQKGQHLFFLSENERTVSLSPEHRDAYYFYLVFFDKEGNAVDLEPRLASDIYRDAELAPASYSVFVDLKSSRK
jgi:Domain of unknown function (DUF3883)